MLTSSGSPNFGTKYPAVPGHGPDDELKRPEDDRGGAARVHRDIDDAIPPMAEERARQREKSETLQRDSDGLEVVPEQGRRGVTHDGHDERCELPESEAEKIEREIEPQGEVDPAPHEDKEEECVADQCREA